MFLPTTKQELIRLGWEQPDVILITGDAYIDSPFIGAAVIGKVLMNAGYRVGVIAQPDMDSDKDIGRLGEPALFWGVTAGSTDSMVANYTALKKRRKSDDFTPGGVNSRRPDRAVIAYANLIRRYFKNTAPIVIGGIEASLRRIAHYDFWSDSIRRSILFDAKADILVYGMGERAAVAVADSIRNQRPVSDIRGICYILREKPADAIELPDFETVRKNPEAFTEMFQVFYQNTDPVSAKPLCQKQDTRWLVQNPPAPNLTPEELDAVYELDFERDAHPFYKQQGSIRALDTIRFSITTHRGCYGECNFCAIAVHQGRAVISRTERSILKEVGLLTQLSDFKGYIHDIGGPSANMYGFGCRKWKTRGVCADRRCLYPEICPGLQVSHARQTALLKKIRSVPGVKQAVVASGVRYDMVLHDRKEGKAYLKEMVRHHVSGQMKIAPEHIQDPVLKRMGKPGRECLLAFRREFERLTTECGKPQFLTYYFIAAHPGCTEQDMKALKEFSSRNLHIRPEQVQIFTPTPSTWSSLMYYTGKDPLTGDSVFVEKNSRQKERQKEILCGLSSGNR